MLVKGGSGMKLPARVLDGARAPAAGRVLLGGLGQGFNQHHNSKEATSPFCWLWSTAG
jgi:hypothetical protein